MSSIKELAEQVEQRIEDRLDEATSRTIDELVKENKRLRRAIKIAMVSAEIPEAIYMQLDDALKHPK